MTHRIGLAVPAQTSDAAIASGPQDARVGPLTYPVVEAIALQPPNQSNTPQKPDSHPHLLSRPPTADGPTQGRLEEEAAPVTTEVVL